MEPVIRELKSSFESLDPSEIEQSEYLSNLTTERLRLIPYPNFAIEFDSPLYLFRFEDRTLAIFGHDLGGYYAVDLESGTVTYIHQEDALYRLQFCNSSFDSFLQFHNLFMQQVKWRIESGNDPQKAVEALETEFRRYDSQATENDDSFWPMRLYELSDDLFPLNDLRINFYRSILDKTK
ncbi:SUKH-4 family immunity protein [Paenibacillus sp. FSL W8-0426]|uniref:SUKH-4 family immunity protein n=1 Tax=Paenibacillus sp. FSL W8-0426 TaxID=2921714 RepID=UPI0030DAD76B